MQEQEQFVTLSMGKTRYQDMGSRTGQVVVLIHGMAMSMFVWERIVTPLVQAGFRVVRYDLVGRGHSDKPSVVYNLSLFEQQWLELLQHLRINAPVHLVGTSMGGAIATHLAATHPHRIHKLALVAPAGLPFQMPWLVRLAQQHRFSRLLMKWFGDQILSRSVARSLVAPQQAPEFLAEFTKQLQDPGFHQAILSSIQHMPLRSMEKTYRRIAELNIPTLLFWGTKDRILPHNLHRQVQTAIPQTQFISIENMGHIPHYEQPESVLLPLLAFLQTETQRDD